MKYLSISMLFASVIIGGCDKKTISLPDTQEDLTFAPGGMPAKPVSNPNLADSAIDNPARETGQGNLADNLALHQKYIKTVELLLKSQQEGSALAEKNRQLTAKVATLTDELQETKVELSDANEMLMTLGEELKKWKADIFAYRKELMDSINQIKQTQEKTMRFLGADAPADKPAETKTETAMNNDQ